MKCHSNDYIKKFTLFFFDLISHFASKDVNRSYNIFNRVSRRLLIWIMYKRWNEHSPRKTCGWQTYSNRYSLSDWRSRCYSTRGSIYCERRQHEYKIIPFLASTTEKIVWITNVEIEIRIRIHDHDIAPHKMWMDFSFWLWFSTFLYTINCNTFDLNRKMGKNKEKSALNNIYSLASSSPTSRFRFSVILVPTAESVTNDVYVILLVRYVFAIVIIRRWHVCNPPTL